MKRFQNAALFVAAFVLIAATLSVLVSPFAPMQQVHAQGGTPYVGTCQAYPVATTGYTLVFTNNGGMFVNVQVGYYTSGTVNSVTTQLYGGYVLQATSNPFALGSSATNTTSADITSQSGSYPYWYINTSTLTGGGTVNYTVCVSNAVTKQSLLSTVPVTLGGTGLATLTTSAIYKGAGTASPVVSSATDDGTTFAIATNKFTVTESSGNALAAGTFTPTLGIVPAATVLSTFWADPGSPSATTSGTDTAGIANQLWFTSVFIPANATMTGACYLIGSVGGTDKAVLSLYNTAGTLLANTTVAAGGTTVGTTAQLQCIAFTSPYAAVGPAHYLIGVNTNGTTAKIRTHPITGAQFVASSASQTTATPATITPTLTYTVSTGPYMNVYGTM